MPYRAYHDRTGERYGRLLVIGYIGIRDHSRIWLCKCDCGTVKEIPWKQLQQNHTRSCGCLWREMLAKRGGWNKKAEGVSAFNQLFFNYKKSARERGHDFELSKQEFRALTQDNCYYCGAEPFATAPRAKGTNGDYIYNGIDRIDNTIGYLPGNVRACCKQCNFAKGTLSEADFLDWIRRVYHNLNDKQSAYTAARQARFEHGETPNGKS